MEEPKKDEASTQGKKEEPMIFLNDRSILPWEGSLPEGRISWLHFYNGSTEIKGSIGYSTIDTQIGMYSILAGAMTYMADIVRLGKDELAYMAEEKTKPETEIFFIGGILVSKNGIVRGTKIKGMDIIQMGKIWYVQKPNRILTEGDGLRHILFGQEETIEGKEKRIEAIVRGYQYQEDQENQRQSSLRYESWRSGRDEARERYGGRW